MIYNNIKTRKRQFHSWVFFVGFLLTVFSFPLSVFAQSDEDRIIELRKQIEELERQAAQFKTNIAGEQAKAKSLRGEISILENQIKKLQTQISITSKNIDKTKIEIGNLETNIFDTHQKINYKKDSVGRLLLTLQRQDRENLLMVLIKNANLSDFLKQSQYAANVNTALLTLIDELKADKKNLEDTKSVAEDKKQELEELNKKQREQNSSLGQAKTGKNQLLTQTKGQEARYKKMLEDVEKKKTAFFNELKELELKVISGGLYIVHITADSIPPKGTKIFKWPEDDYHITQGYGMTTYAKRGAYGGAPHNGIDMAAGRGSPIKAIGDGQIVANGTNDGWGNWVAIKHVNNMVSVYGHMSSLSFLKVGSQVKVGDVIGYEGDTGNATGSHLHLSLYREFFTYLNSKKNGQLYFNYFEGSINPLDYL